MQMVDYLSHVLLFHKLKTDYYFICVHFPAPLLPYTIRQDKLLRSALNCIRIQITSNDMYATFSIIPYKILSLPFIVVCFESKSEIFWVVEMLLFNLIHSDEIHLSSNRFRHFAQSACKNTLISR